MDKHKTIPTPVDYEAYFEVTIPPELYMHNVLLTFVHAIPRECHRFCASNAYPTADVEKVTEAERQTFLRAFVEERLRQLVFATSSDWRKETMAAITTAFHGLTHVRMVFLGRSKLLSHTSCMAGCGAGSSTCTSTSKTLFGRILSELGSVS